MTAVRKRHVFRRDGSEAVMLGKVIFREKPSRGRRSRHDWDFSIETLRLREIEQVIRHRHGSGIPDARGTDDLPTCLAYLRAVALTPKVQDVVSWSAVFAPWVDPTTLETIGALRLGRKRMLKADVIAKLLDVRAVERKALSLKTIGACDMSEDDRKALTKEGKRERDRKRQAGLRRAEGRKDRASYEAASITRLKPWESAGLSRSKWYRQQRETGLSRVVRIRKGDTLVSSAETGATVQTDQARVAGLIVGLGDHPPAGLQGAAPHGSGDTQSHQQGERSAS